MNPLAWLGKQLDNGWFSRLLVVAQFWLAFSQTLWAQSFMSTALALGRDLMGASAGVAAVYLGPQALLFAATKFYMDARAAQPVVISDRRKKDADH